tara:strand:- start:950 stop:2059 length:1110 start_codon:yes stop_codon:yes gene_type:complete
MIFGHLIGIQLMNKFKNSLFLFFIILFLIELISFSIVKFNLLEISHIPKIYLSNKIVPNDEWWTEEKKWGPWHKANSSTLQKRSCFDVKYSSNEVGARDSSFKSNSENDIILLGDSFAEGYGVNYDDTSQKHIEKLNNTNVLNFGVSQNFGPVQYWLIYNEYAKKFNHSTLIIYFLPDNDFGENDYSNWKGSKRYRPYYKKTSKNNYEIFIPEKSIKNYRSTTKKIKKVFKDFLWSSNLFVNLNYEYKIYRSNKRASNTNFSAYFDTSLKQQKAAIFFLDKIINTSSANVILVSIPRIQDFKRLSDGYKLEKVYWNNYFSQKDKSNKKFKFVDLIKFPPKDINEIFLKCDGHWSPKGNMWSALIISKYL